MTLRWLQVVEVQSERNEYLRAPLGIYDLYENSGIPEKTKTPIMVWDVILWGLEKSYYRQRTRNSISDLFGYSPPTAAFTTASKTQYLLASQMLRFKKIATILNLATPEYY